MDKQSVNVRGHLRKGFAVRPYVRSMLLGLKTKNKNHLKTQLSAPTEGEVVPPQQLSQQEYLSFAEEEYKKIGNLENRITKRFVFPAQILWVTGAVSMVAASVLTSGLAGMATILGGIWILLAAIPILGFGSFVEKLKKRAAVKASRKISEQNERPSKQYLEQINQELGEPEQKPWENWNERKDEPPSEGNQFLGRDRLPPNGLEIHQDGTATLTQWNQAKIPVALQIDYPIAETIQLYPRADLSGRTINTPFYAWYTDLREADFSNTKFFAPATFRSALLQGANFSNIDTREMDFVNSDLRNANFENAVIHRSSFRNAQIDGANFKNAKIQNTRKINIDLSDDQLLSLHPDSFNPSSTRDLIIYDQISFEDAIETLGLTEKQFEFLVTSGGLQVRSNETQEVVDKNFSPKNHHITRRDLIMMKRTLNNS